MVKVSSLTMMSAVKGGGKYDSDGDGDIDCDEKEDKDGRSQ